jgi:hypothetical protein
VELRRGDHRAARLQMERERLAREREQTGEDVVEHFRRWAQNLKVRDWVCQTWLSPQERDRRLREILGLEPREIQTSPAEPESNSIKPNQTGFSAGEEA